MACERANADVSASVVAAVCDSLTTIAVRIEKTRRAATPVRTFTEPTKIDQYDFALLIDT